MRCPVELDGLHVLHVAILAGYLVDDIFLLFHWDLLPMKVKEKVLMEKKKDVLRSLMFIRSIEAYFMIIPYIATSL